MSGRKSVTLVSFKNGLQKWSLSTAGRGESGSLRPVVCTHGAFRGGRAFLKLCYDFTRALEHTTLGIYAGPGCPVELPENTAGIGLWVYTDANAQGCLLRMNLVDGNGDMHTLNFTDSPVGIDWVGWSYRVAEISGNLPHPLRLSETQAVRLLSVPCGQDGPMTRGTVCFSRIDALFDISPEGVAPYRESKENNLQSENIRLRLIPDGDSVHVGGFLRLNLIPENMEKITSFTCTITFAPDDLVKEKKLIVFSGQACSGCVDDSGAIVIHGTEIPEGGLIAQVVIRITNTVTRGMKLSCFLDGRLTGCFPDSGRQSDAFLHAMTPVPIQETCTLSVEKALVGVEGILLVTDSQGNPEAGAEIYTLGDDNTSEYLGSTGHDGRLRSKLLTKASQRYFLYAKKGRAYSYVTRFEAFLPLLGGEPARLHITGIGSDGSRRLVWLTSPVESGETPEVILYDRHTDHTPTVFQGHSCYAGFSGNADPSQNGLVRVNTVDLHRLQPGSSCFLRIGDGSCFSPVHTLSIPPIQSRFHFAVFGDTQAETLHDISGFHKLLGLALRHSPSFFIHLGDITDNASIFSGWDIIFGELEAQKLTELLPCIGNHEYFGDLHACTAESVLGISRSTICPGLYSVDRSNLHIAVLSYTHGEKQLRQALDWLLEDMERSHKPWKIVVTHQPPYYTNPDGDNALMAELLPPVCDKACIDIVFSGHDHSYGRTAPLLAGKPSDMGTVYVVGGTTGPKFYPAVANRWFTVTGPEQQRLYLDCEVDDQWMTVTAVTEDNLVLDHFSVTRHAGIK